MKNLSMPHIPKALFLLSALLATIPLLAHAGVAGRFQFVYGDVRIIAAGGQERPAKKGAEISEGETLVSAKNGGAQLRMIDDGIIALRPDTRMTIETFHYNGKEDGTEKSSLSLVKGGFRAITGAIGHINKQNYQIKTPSATIGIRGTDHEPMFIPAPALGETALGKPGTYEKVNVGGVVMATPQGSLALGPNQVGYVESMNAKPTALQQMPAFYRAAPPAAEKKKSEGEEKKDQKSADGDSKKEQKSGEGDSKKEQKSGEGDSKKDQKSADNDSRKPAAGDGEGKKPGGGNASAGDKPAAPPPPPAMADTGDALPPPPPPMTVKPTAGNYNFSNPVGSAKLAPTGYAIFGAFSGTNLNCGGGGSCGSGGMLIDGVAGKSLYLGPNQEVVTVADTSSGGNFKYNAGSTTLEVTGSTTVGGSTVSWGRYVGADTMIDQGVNQDPVASHFVVSSSYMPADATVNVASATYTNVGHSITNNLGQTGTMSATIVANFTTHQITSYSLTVNVPGANGQVSGSGSFASFYNNGSSGGGITLNTATGDPLTGHASGAFVGSYNSTTAPGGVISSFDLKNSSNGTTVGGVFVAK